MSFIRNRKALWGIFLSVFVGAIAASACGGDNSGLNYQPAAYGQQVQIQQGQQYQQATANGFQTVTAQQPMDSWVCWIASDYHEAVLLAASGACPNAWVPILMASLSQGIYWHQMYAGYYDGFGYYGRYVPSAYRTTYVKNVTVFETHYHTQIAKAENSSSARWKGSDGHSYSGATVTKYAASGHASFGSGSVRSHSFTSSGSTSTRSGSSSTTRSSSSSSGSTRSSSSGRYTGGSSGSFGGGSRSSSGTSFGGLSSASSGSSRSFAGGSGRR